MDSRLFDEMLRVENHHWWFVARRKIINAFIKRAEFKDNIRIFEIGCGNGANLEFLSAHGDVTAIEKSEIALEYASKKNIGTIKQGELPDGIPNDINEEFDLVVMLDVLEHIEDDEECIKVLRNRVSKNGKLLLTIPAHQYLWSVHDEIHHHKRRYSIKQIRELLSKNGWSIKYISYFNTLLFPLAFIDRKYGSAPSKKDYKISIPKKWLNWSLQKIFNLEQHLIGIVSYPFGLSIIAFAEINDK